jgi:methyl-accepting chemotaxis protein
LSKIKEGSQLVVQHRRGLQQVRKAARKVAELVGEIAAASQEQAQGIGQ